MMTLKKWYNIKFYLDIRYILKFLFDWKKINFWYSDYNIETNHWIYYFANSNCHVPLLIILKINKKLVSRVDKAISKWRYSRYGFYFFKESDI